MRNFYVLLSKIKEFVDLLLNDNAAFKKRNRYNNTRSAHLISLSSITPEYNKTQNLLFMQTCTRTTHKKSTIGFNRWMMTLVIALMAMTVSFHSKAQVYFTEGFESEFTPNTAAGPNAPSGWVQTRLGTLTGSPGTPGVSGQRDWARSVNSGTNVWASNTAPNVNQAPYNVTLTTLPNTAYAGTGAAWFNDGYAAGSGTTGQNIRRLESPSIDLSAAGNPVVQFAYSLYGGTCTMNLVASNDGGTTWNTLGTYSSLGSSNAWSVQVVTLPAIYKVANAKIGFVANNTWGSYDLFLDAVSVREAVLSAAPTNFTATAVTQTSFTIGWTDNSTDETAFKVYRSTDNVTFTQVGSNISSTTTAGTGTTYSSAQTGLIPGVTYYFRITAVNGDGESAFLTGSQATNAPGSITSVATGLWSSPSTWSTNAVPTATDNVTIADGNTVTIDVAAVALNLTVGQGTSGVLQFDATTARTLTVGQSVTVATGATLQSAATGTVTTHQLIVGTDLTNNGTINFSTNGNTAGAELRFNNATNNTFSGTGSNVLRLLTVNKGSGNITTNSPVLDVTTTFSFGGTTTSFGVNTTTYNGILKISGSSTWSNALFTTASYSIPATGGLWLNNPNFTMTATNGSPTMSGLLRVTAGTLNVGTAAGNSMGGATTSQFIIEGGTLNFASRFNVTSSGAVFNMSGGTININTVGNTSSSTASFGFTSTTSVFTMSGGTINLVQRSTGATPLDWNVATTTPNITGGTLNVGTAATATNFDFRLQGAVPNLVINNTTNNKSVLASAALTIYGSATINSGTILNANGFNINFRGAISNSGTVTATTAGSVLTFQGSAAQTLGGTITSSQIAGVTVNNAAGVVITPSVQINTSLTVTAGSLSSGGTLTLGNGGTNNFTFSSAVASALSGTVALNYGTGTNAFTYNGAVAQNTGAELPATVSTLTINNSNAGGVTLNSPVSVASTLTLTAGTLNTSSSNLVTVTATTTGSIVRTSGYVNGPLARTLPASLASGSTYLMPIGKSAYQGLSMINPTTSAAGTLVVKAEVFDADPAGTYTGFTSLTNNRYWKVDLSGAGALTANGSVNLTETGLTTTSKIGQSVGTSASGTYSNVGGTVVTGTPGNITNVSTLANYGTGANSTFFITGAPAAFGAGIYAVGPTANGSTLQPDGITPYDGFFANLTDAFAAANNAATATGNVIFELQNDYVSTSETFPITSTFQGTATSTLTVRPRSDLSGSLSIAGSSATTIIDLNSAKYHIIDGRPGATGSAKALVISNTNTSGAAIRFINDAQNNIVRYDTIKSVNTSTTSGTILFSTTTGANGNDNNTIDNNDIRDGATTPINGIYSAGTTTTTATNNSGNVISNNNIFNFFGAGTANNGINISSGSTDWTISGNSFYQTATRTYTAAVVTTGINIQTGNNHLVSGNFIGGTAANAGGTAWTNAGAFNNQFVGIRLSTSTTTPASVQGNTIANFNWTGTGTTTAPGEWTGIYLSSGLANIGDVTGNTIGSGTGTGSVTVTTTSAASASFGIYNASSSATAALPLLIRNNTIGSVTVVGSASIAHSFTGISQSGAATKAYVNNNTVGSTSTAASINASSALTATTNQSVTGIAVTSGTSNMVYGNTVANLTNAVVATSAITSTSQVRGIAITSGLDTVYNNTIRDLSSNSNLQTNTGATASVIGLSITATTAGQLDSANTIYNLSNTSASGVSVTGLYYGGATSGTNVVTRNFIYALNASNTAAAISGIAVGSGPVTTFKNNMISLGTGNTNGPTIYGINEISSTTTSSNFYFNSVYIGGSGVTTGASNTYAFFSAVTTATRNYRNNIFVNARSNSGGTGKHYAIRVGGTTANPTGLTTNYNILNVSGTGGVTGFFASADQINLAVWKTATGQDNNSYSNDPQFVNPTSATPDLHINTSVASVAEGNGVAIAGVDDDFDGQARAGLTPTDIGADAFNGIVAAPQVFAYAANPATGQCAATSHAITARVTSPSGSDITSVFLNYSFNGGTPTSVRMTTDSGAVNATARWIATIPAATPSSALVTWNIVATDTVLSIPTTVTGSSYRDQYLDIINVTTSATPSTICQGQSVTLAATLPSSFAIGTDNAATKIQTTGNVFRSGAGTVAVKNQYLILASELTAAGLQAGPILSLGFTQTANTGTPVFNNFRLEMALTSTSVLSSSWTSASFTTVYGGTGTTVNPVIGLNTYTFNAPFNWDGTSNILIQTCGVFAGTTGTSTLATTTTSFIAAMGGASGTDCAVNPSGSTVSNARPVITLGVNGFAPYTLAWKEGATVLTTTNTATVTPASAGTSTYTFNLTDGNGCTKTLTQNVTVNSLPSDPIGQDTTLCGAGIPTGAKVTSRDGTPVPTFKWYDAASGGTLLQSGTANYYQNIITATTVFYVSEYNVTTGCEGPRTMVTANVNNPNPINATATPYYFCLNGSTTLTAVNTGDGTNNYSYSWSASPSGTSGLPGTVTYDSVVSVTPTAAGSYVYTVIATDAVLGCTAIDTVQVTVNPNPVITSATATPNTACAGAPVALVAASVPSSAGNATVGTGTTVNTTTSYPAPFGNYYWGAKNQMLITAAELTAAGLVAGNITSVAFDVVTPSTATLLGFTVNMKATSLTALTAFETTGFTTVYSNASYTPSASGGYANNTIVFSTPFNWDGTSNIIIETCFASSSFTTNAVFNQSATAYQSTLVYRADASTVCSVAPTISSSHSQRPNMRFGGQVGTNLTGSYTWNWTGEQSLTGSSVTGNPVTSPTSTYNVTATNPTTGCSSAASTVTVNVNPLPAAPTGHDSTHCGLGANVAYVTSNSGASTPTFKWYSAANGGSLLQSGTSATYTTPTAATATYYVTEVSALGCESSPRVAVTETVTTPDAITATVSPNDSICFGGTFDLSVTQTGSTNNYTYSWICTSANASTSGVSTATAGQTLVGVSPSAAGTYTYQVTAVDAAAGCTTTSTITVVVSPNPLITSATATPSTICAGDLVTLVGQSIQSAPGSATVGTQTTTEFSGGVYRLGYGTGDFRHQLLVTASELNAAGIVAGNLTSLTFNVTSVGSGSANNYTIKLAHTTASALTTTFQSATFTTVYTAATYTPVSGNNVHTFSTPFNWDGTSNLLVEICYNVSTIGGSSTVAANTPSFIGNTQLLGTTGACTAATGSTFANRPLMTFGAQVGADLTGNYNWTWNPGSLSGSSVSVNPVTSPTSTYTVTATDPVTGCFSTQNVSVTVNPLPATPTASNSTQCGGHVPTASVSSNSGLPNPQFKWYDAASGGTLLQGPSTATTYGVVVSTVGVNNFYVSEYNPATGCEGARVNVQVTVTAPPSISASVTQATICAGQSTTLNATSSNDPNYNYVWQPGGLSGASTSVSPTTTTTYKVYGTDGASGCSDSATVTVTVNPAPAVPTITRTNPLPVQVLGNSVGLCFGSSITMSAASSTSGATTAWTVYGSGANSEVLVSADTLNVGAASQDETYTATATITATGCTSTTNITVLVGAPLVVNTSVSPNDTVCSGTSVTLSANITGGGDNPVFTWYEVGNATSIGSGANFTLTPASGDHDYYVNVTDDCGNDVNDTIHVLVHALPVVAVTPNTALICGTGSVTLTATGASTYSWTPATGLSATTGSSVLATPTVTTKYYVTGTDANGCVNTDSTTITVAEAASLSVAVDKNSVCAGDSVHLTSTTGILHAQNFETFPLSGYVVSGTNATATQNTTYYAQGSSSVLFNTTSTSTTATLTLSSNLDLSGKSGVTLSFKHIAAMEGASTSYDYGYVEYSMNGGSTWTTFPATSYTGSANNALFTSGNVRFSTKSYPDWISQFTSSSATPGTGPATALWKTETFNLPAGAYTSQFRLRFRYTTDVSTNYYGWLIDDVVISKPGAAIATYAWTSNNPSVTFGTPNAASTVANNVNATTKFYLTGTSAAGCSATDSVTVTVAPLSVVATQTNTGTVCSGTANTLTATISGGAPNYYYWWSTNGSDTVGTTATLVVSPMATTTYTVTVRDTCGSVATSSVTANVYNPQPVETTGATRCGQGSVTLTAAPGTNQRLNWFAAATGGTSLGVGSSFTTNVSATTTYYVQATDTSSVASFTTGLVSDAASNLGSITGPYGMYFSATQSVVINSVDVYPSAAGTLVITLYNASSVAQATASFTITSGDISNTVKKTLPLNFTIPAGSTGWRISYSGVAIYRGSVGTYPYPSATINGFTITGNTLDGNNITSGTRYFFYNWQMSTAGCSGARVPVVATVTAPPSVSISPATASICAGQSVTLTASSSNDPNYKYTWNNGAGTGAVVSVSPNASTTYTVSAVDTTAGANAGCNITASASVMVNPLPGVLTVTPSAITICQGASTTLTASVANATGVAVIGTGNVSNTTTTPYKGFYGSQKVQMLYTAAELNALGLSAGSVINSVGFNISSYTSPYGFGGFNIKMKHTNSTSLSTTFESGATTVFGPISYTLTGTAPFSTTHTLTTPWTWDGSSNLLVEICFNNQDAGGSSGNSANVVSTTTTNNSVAYASVDNIDSTCSKVLATTSTTRPNIRLGYNNGITYSWSGTGLNTTTGSSVIASPTTTTTYTVTATNVAGCTKTATTTVTVSAPVSTLSAQTNATCPGATNGSFTVAGSGGVAPYQYSINGGTTYQASGTFSSLGAGTYVVTTKDANNCVGLTTLSVTISDNDTISPVITTCATDQTVTANSSCQYPVPDFTSEVVATDNCVGSITITQNPIAGTLVGVGTTVVKLTATDAAGNKDSCTVNLNVNGQTFTVGSISGPTNACPYMGAIGDTATYTISATSAVSYNWTWPAAFVYVSGQGTNTLRIKYNTTFVSGSIGVTVTGPTCTTPEVRSLSVTKATPALPGTISGPTNACVYIGTSTPVTYSIAPVANAITYRWTLPANTTLVSATPDSLSVTITFDANFASGTVAQRTIKVKAISGCGNSADRTLAIGITAPATPGPITGPINVCQYVGGVGGNAVYTIRKVANATSYNWTVPSSATIVSYSGGGNSANDTSIVVSFNNTFVAGSIDSVKVSASSVCGTSANRSLALKPVNPATPGPITGVTDACPYTGTGIEVVYTIRQVPTATSYQWTLPAGVTFGPSDLDNTDTIAYLLYDSTFTGGFMTVRSVSGCGQSSTVRGLTISLKKPVTPAAIVGPTDVCPLMGLDTTVYYTIRKVNYATYYTWVTPVGAQVVSHPGGLGVNDTIIEVKWLNTFNTGYISVVASNNCANSGTRSLTIMRKIPGTPAPISGPTDACPLMGTASTATYTIAPVLNATSYNWTVPSGATIISGQGTTSITVSYDNTFTLGNVAVSAVNNCWASTFRTLAITRKLPAVPGAISATTPTGCPNKQVTYTIAPALNATGYLWTVPAGATIVSGQGTTSIVVEYPNTSVSDTVRVQSTNNCAISAERKLKVTLTACPPVIAKVTPTQGKTVPVEIAPELEVTVMPNPSTHQFTIVVKSNNLTTPIQMQVADMSGRATEIRRGLMPGQTIIVGSNYRQGVYLAEFVQGNNRKTVKLIKLQ
jgi:hypothetical protein